MLKRSGRRLCICAAFLLGAFLFFSLLAEASDAPPFAVGEKTRYAIHASGIKIGYQTIEIASLVELQGVQTYLLKGQTTASALVSILYRLDDRWTISMEKESFYPVRVEKEWEEGKGEGFYIYEIDQNNRVVRFRDIKKNKEKVLHAQNPIFDLFSLLYYYRVNALSIEKHFTFDFLETKGLKTVSFQDEGVGQLTVSSISVTRPVAVRRFKQIGGVGIELYVSNDALRLPLKLVTPAKLSKKKTVLVEFIIDGYSAGSDQREMPKEYRRLKY